MDPNQSYSGQNYVPGGESEGEQTYEDFNSSMLYQPEAYCPVDDPSAYTAFDYEANPEDAWQWDPQQEEAGSSYEAGAGPSSEEPGSKGGKGKGKAKAPSSGGKGGQIAQPAEYRFKDDLPKAADWEAQKAKIKELYMTQKLNLKDVVEIMKEQHQFNATERMYKHQFKKWNWSKYKPKDKK